MSGDAPARYALRVLPRAAGDVEAHLERVKVMAGRDVADSWREGLFHAVATLAQNPRRCPLIAEHERFPYETRQLLYRRTAGGPAWRILFTIATHDDDVPSVVVLHVRHGAQRPIGREEAAEIVSDQ